MSPLVSSPARGYADWQRLDNWDSAPLFSETNIDIAGTHSSPVLDVSRYAYIGGYDISNANPAVVGFNWFADAAATITLGGVEFLLSPLIQDFAQYRLPNLGPFLQVSWAQVVAGHPSHTCRLIGTNRAHPLEFIPEGPLQYNIQSVALAAGAVVNIYPTDYYAGPMRVWGFFGAGFQWSLQTLLPDGTWIFIDQSPPTTVTTDVSAVTITPRGAWRFQIFNGGGAPFNYSFAAQPSQTGSS